jgi:hypothetical protein
MVIFNSYVKLPEGKTKSLVLDLWILSAPYWRYFMLGRTDSLHTIDVICLFQATFITGP